MTFPRRVAALLLAATALLIQLGPARAETLEARLDAAVRRALDEHRIVGAVVIVARHGRIVYRKAAGLADRERGTPMREDALFRLASVSKSIVSAAALALVDQGRLGLDDPVSRWLPWFRPALADGTRPEITVRQLLTHTSGLTYRFQQPPGGPYAAAGVSDGLDRTGTTLEENLAKLASAPLEFAPGSRWNYSLAIDVLGAVAARAGGAPLPEVVARTVTGPLHMKDTGFWAADPDRLAVPYVSAKGGPRRMGDPDDMPFGASAVRFQPSRATDPAAYPSGGAGMCGTAGDFIAFLEAVRTGGGGIVAPATARAMTENQVGAIRPLAEQGLGFGFGGAVMLAPGRSGHSGRAGAWTWGGAYGHHWFMDRRAGLSVAVFTNTTPEGMVGEFADDVTRAVYDE